MVLSSYVAGDIIEYARIDWEEGKIFRGGRAGNKEFCFSSIEFEISSRHLNRQSSGEGGRGCDTDFTDHM